MIWSYKVGTKVKITAEGHALYGDGPGNPRNTVGIVDSIGYYVGVRWPNAIQNAYREGTLVPVQINLENK